MAQRKVKMETSPALPNEQIAPMRLSIEEARALMLAAQGLLDPPPARPTRAEMLAMIERLGVVQIDTINVARRSQYLVLWSRLGAYDEALFDKLLHPERAHLRILVPCRLDSADVRLSDVPGDDGGSAERLLYDDYRDWAEKHPDIVTTTMNAIRERGAAGLGGLRASQ